MTEKHLVVSHQDWMNARKAFLVKEKEFTRLREELSQARRNLPWEAVTKTYVFEGSNGTVPLSDLFAGRSQLVVYHFMFGPDWEAGCPHCSFWADNFNGVIAHLNRKRPADPPVKPPRCGAISRFSTGGRDGQGWGTGSVLARAR